MLVVVDVATHSLDQLTVNLDQLEITNSFVLGYSVMMMSDQQYCIVIKVSMIK